MLDIAERSAKYEQSTERQAELDARERRYGGLVPGDRAAEEKRSALKGWGPYRPSSAAEIKAGIVGVADVRSIKIGRLWNDCGRAVERWASKLDRSDRETLHADVFQLIVRWTSHGGGLRSDGTRAPITDLGGLHEQRRAERHAAKQPTAARRALAWIDAAERITDGTLPPRREWIHTESGQPTVGAWRALHAAVLQSRDRAEFKAALPSETETPTDPLDLVAAMEREQLDAAEPVRLADSETPETLARLLDCSLSIGRAIVARAFPHATPTELAEQWGISRESVNVSLSSGAAALRKRWPDPADLLDALDVAAVEYRAETERDATLALLDYRGEAWSADYVRRMARERAESAIADWRGCTLGMPADALALLAAARERLRHASAVGLNCGESYGAERAERIAASVPRLLDAEQRAARRRTRVARTGRLHKCARAAQRVRRAAMASDALLKLAEQRSEIARQLAAAESANPGVGCNADRLAELRAAERSRERQERSD